MHLFTKTLRETHNTQWQHWTYKFILSTEPCLPRRPVHSHPHLLTKFEYKWPSITWHVNSPCLSGILSQKAAMSGAACGHFSLSTQALSPVEFSHFQRSFVFSYTAGWMLPVCQHLRLGIFWDCHLIITALPTYTPSTGFNSMLIAVSAALS